MKRVIIIVFICLSISNGTFAQQCRKYKIFFEKGDKYLKAGDFKRALQAFLVATVASRECNLKEDHIAEKLSKVFEGMDQLAIKAKKEEQNARRAYVLTEQSLKKETAAKERANALRNLTVSQANATSAYNLSEKDPTQAVGLSLSSLAIHDNDLATRAMLKAFNINSWFYSKKLDGVLYVDLSADGRKIAISRLGRVELVTIADGKELILSYPDTRVKFLPNGNIFLTTAISSDTKSDARETILLNPEGKVIKRFDGNLSPFAVDKDGVFGIREKNTKQLVRMDNLTGELEIENLPQSLDSINLDIFAHDDIAVIKGDSSALYVSNVRGQSTPILIPRNVRVIDIDFEGNNMIVYAKAKSRRIYGGYSIINLDSLEHAKNKLNELITVHLEGVNMIRCLDEDRIIISSSGGTCVIVKSRNGNPIQSINAFRTAEVIRVLKKDSLIAIARRSGATGIYDYNGVLRSNLIGIDVSDGSNKAYYDLITDDSNSMILTSSPDGARLWHKPRYNLVVKRRYLPFRAENLPYFNKMFDSNYFKAVAMNPSGEMKLVRDDSGEFLLNFKLGEENDKFKTGLYSGSSKPVTGRYIAFEGYSVRTDADYDRLFMLNRAVVMPLLLREKSDGRLLRSLQVVSIADEKEYKMMRFGKLSPVPSEKKQ